MIIKSLHFPLALLLLCLALSACSQGEGEFLDSARAAVYVSGAYNNQACYWVDDGDGVRRITLQVPLGTTQSLANSIFVEKGTVYTVGYYVYPQQTACCWVNEKLITLPGTLPSQAYALWVQDGTIYIAGYCNMNRAGYWINTTYHDLSTEIDGSSSPSYAMSIQREGANLYIAGYYPNGALDIWYKKNSESIKYLPGSNNAVISKMHVYNDTIHICAFITGGVHYWRNGDWIASFNAQSSYFSLVYDAGNVYIAANAPYTGLPYAVLYTVGLPSPQVITPPSLMSSSCTGIKAAGRSLFISGWDNAQNTLWYWVDGRKVILETGTSIDATAIFVAPKSQAE